MSWVSSKFSLCSNVLICGAACDIVLKISIMRSDFILSPATINAWIDLIEKSCQKSTFVAYVACFCHYPSNIISICIFYPLVADVFEEFFSPVMAAQGLLHSSVSKRKEVLQKTMGFLMQLLGTPGLEPQQKAGCLHMVGSIADVLLQKKIYKDQMELMLVNHVYPEFGSEHGYLRARVSHA